MLSYGLVLALFVASGFSSLIYQVVWTRLLVLVFGSTTFATATVLAVFMGGLALGSYLAGRYAYRVNTLFWYAILEGVTGVWALIVPWLFALAVPVYRLVWQHVHLSLIPFGLLRFAIATVILIVPTACMGATLPLLARYVTGRLDMVGQRVGMLYALNTMGAVGGALAAGFVLVPLWGRQVATIVASVINLLICALVLRLAAARPQPASVPNWQLTTGRQGAGSAAGSRSQAGSLSKPAGAVGCLPQSAPGSPLPPGNSNPAGSQNGSLKSPPRPVSNVVPLCMIAFGLSGAIAMIYEVGWTRTLLMVIGSTTYAFTIMLSTFLIGIFMGSLVCARFVDRAQRPLLWFAILQVAVAIAGFISIGLFNYLPYWNLLLNARFPHLPWISLVARFVLASSMLLPLTGCLGALFPVSVKACVKDFEAIGKSVGGLYSANTMGAIAGALLAGFALIPWLGAGKTLLLAGAFNFLIGMALLAALPGASLWARGMATICGVGVLIFCCLLPPLWDPVVVGVAQAERRRLLRVPMDTHNYNEWKKEMHQWVEIPFWKDGISSSVAVISQLSNRHLTLMTNGHADGSNVGDMGVQTLLAAYPLLLNPKVQDVAVIGWGTGVTVGTALKFPVKSVTAIELEPAVIEASKYFHGVNGAPETDSRLQLEINDGRNYLASTDKEFDLIISEPSNPWQAGVCNLFTREYFQLCHNRLKPGGMFALWLQTAEISPLNVRGILAALKSEFKYALAFVVDSSNIAVIGSDYPLTISNQQLMRALASKSVVAALTDLDAATPASIAARIYLSPEAITRLAQGARPNVDDTNKLEFAIGSSYENQRYVEANRDMFVRQMTDPTRLISFGPVSDKQKAQMMALIAMDALVFDRPNQTVLAWARASMACAPNSEALRALGIVSFESGETQQADRLWKEALELDPQDLFVLRTIAEAHMRTGDLPGARAYLERAINIQPDDKTARDLLSVLDKRQHP